MIECAIKMQTVDGQRYAIRPHRLPSRPQPTQRVGRVFGDSRESRPSSGQGHRQGIEGSRGHPLHSRTCDNNSSNPLFGLLGVFVQNGIRNMGYVLKCKQFFERVVGKECTAFRQRCTFEKAEDRPHDFTEHFLFSRLRRNDVKFDVHVRMKCHCGTGQTG